MAINMIKFAYLEKYTVTTMRRKRVERSQGLLQQYEKEKARARKKSVVMGKVRMRKLLKYLVSRTGSIIWESMREKQQSWMVQVAWENDEAILQNTALKRKKVYGNKENDGLVLDSFDLRCLWAGNRLGRCTHGYGPQERYPCQKYRLSSDLFYDFLLGKQSIPKAFITSNKPMALNFTLLAHISLLSYRHVYQTFRISSGNLRGASNSMCEKQNF